jgi:hypothetical protein
VDGFAVFFGVEEHLADIVKAARFACLGIVGSGEARLVDDHVAVVTDVNTVTDVREDWSRHLPELQQLASTQPNKNTIGMIRRVPACFIGLLCV